MLQKKTESELESLYQKNKKQTKLNDDDDDCCVCVFIKPKSK